MGYEKAQELPQGNTQNPRVNTNENNVNPSQAESRQNVANRNTQEATTQQEAIQEKAQNTNEIHKNEDSIIKSTGNNNTEHEMKEAIPQTNEEIIQQAKAEGKSVEETKGLIKLESIKQKTIHAVDKYAQSEEFKTLSKDKQEAILRLKSINPAPMPENIKVRDFENLRSHFEGKADEQKRADFLRLFEETKRTPDITLEVFKNGELRQEYIKAYQHKETKDLYYLVISKENKDITGIPTTKISKVLNDIAKSERVLPRI